MPYTCKLTDGVEEIDLYYNLSAGFSLLDEGIKPGKPQAFDLYGGIAETELVRHFEGNRTIPLELYVEGVSDDDLINRLNNLQRLVNKARDFRLLDLGNEVFLEFSLGGATKTTRFGVISAEIDTARLMSLFCKDAQVIDSLPVVLICKPYWESPETFDLVNELLTPDFEWDSNADGLADNWVLWGASVCAMESTIVFSGCKSQKITTDAADEGIYQTGIVAPAGTTKAVAYAWICRPAAGSDIAVVLWDTTAGVARDTQLLSTVGWQTKVIGGNTWYRVVVSSNAIVAGNNHTIYVPTLAATPTVFYADMAFWMWGTTTPPDAWCSSSHIMMHYDTGASGHEGHLNYIDIVDIPGEMPALTKITLENDYNVAARPYTLYIAQRTRETVAQECEVATLKPVLEAENANYSTGTPAADTSCSNGYRVDWPSLAHADWTIIARWNIDPANIKEWGGYWKIVGAAANGDWSPGKYRIRTTFESLTEYEVGEGVSSATELVNFGSFLIPPAPMEEGNPMIFRIELQFKGSGGSLYLDYLYLLPLDGFQVLKFKGYGLPYAYRWRVDGMTEHSWGEYIGERFYMIGHVGDFIELKHRDTQRLFFLIEDNYGNAPIERTTKVNFTYKLRGIHLRGTE